jgi:hypothetical protein
VSGMFSDHPFCSKTRRIFAIYHVERDGINDVVTATYVKLPASNVSGGFGSNVEFGLWDDQARI